MFDITNRMQLIWEVLSEVPGTLRHYGSYLFKGDTWKKLWGSVKENGKQVCTLNNAKKIATESGKVILFVFRGTVKNGLQTIVIVGGFLPILSLAIAYFMGAYPDSSSLSDAANTTMIVVAAKNVTSADIANLVGNTMALFGIATGCCIVSVIKDNFWKFFKYWWKGMVSLPEACEKSVKDHESIKDDVVKLFPLIVQMRGYNKREIAKRVSSYFFPKSVVYTLVNLGFAMSILLTGISPIFLHFLLNDPSGGLNLSYSVQAGAGLLIVLNGLFNEYYEGQTIEKKSKALGLIVENIEKEESEEKDRKIEENKNTIEEDKSMIKKWIKLAPEEHQTLYKNASDNKLSEFLKLLPGLSKEQVKIFTVGKKKFPDNFLFLFNACQQDEMKNVLELLNNEQGRQDIIERINKEETINQEKMKGFFNPKPNFPEVVNENKINHESLNIIENENNKPLNNSNNVKIELISNENNGNIEEKKNHEEIIEKNNIELKNIKIEDVNKKNEKKEKLKVLKEEENDKFNKNKKNVVNPSKIEWINNGINKEVNKDGNLDL